MRTTLPTFVHPRTSWHVAAMFALFLSACGAKQTPENAEESTPETEGSAREIALDTVELPERCETQACINDNADSFEVDGLRVIVKHQENPPLAGAAIYFEGSSLDWTSDTEGHQALALNVATEGGPSTMERRVYHAELERVAASISSSVSRDEARVRLFSPAFALDEIFALMAQSILSPAFEENQLQNSRVKQLSAIRTRFDDADSAVAETTRALAWKDHPYALHSLGEEEPVQNATVDALQDALKKLLVRERMIVVFTGDVQNEQARALVEKHLKDVPHQEDWAQKSNYPEAIAPFAYEGGALELLERANIPTNYILGYFSAPSASEEAYAATVIGMRILRNRLFEEVRTKRNLSYAVSSALANRRANTGALYVTATDPQETLKVMYDTIDDVIENGVSQDDIDNEVRTYLTGYYMDLQSAAAQGYRLAKWQILTGDRVNADRFIDALQEITPEEISAAIDRYLRNIQFGVVGNPEQIDREQFEAR